MLSENKTQQDECAICKKQSELSRCSLCKSIYYCSVDCQKKDWKNHKYICSEIQLKIQRDQQRAERRAQGKKAIEDYADFEVLGHGNFSDIFKVREIETNNLFALKQINKRKLTQVNKEKDVYMEKHCLGKFTENPYVVRLYSTFQDDENLYMLMEYIDGGELWNEIKNYGARSFRLSVYFMSEVIKALQSIHSAGIVHRDIKSENILLTKDKKVKFIDFGTAKDLKDPSIEGSGNGRKGKPAFKNFVGTPQFMAPECIRNKDSTEKSDIYSLGVLFYHIVFGKYPFDGKSDYLIFQQALETELKFPDGWIDNEQFRNLIRKMLQKNAEDRPSLDQIIQDEIWGQQFNQEQDYFEIIKQFDENDKFSYELGEALNYAEKKEEKIQAQYEVQKTLQQFESKIENDVQRQRFVYIKEIIQNIMKNRQDDEEEQQQQQFR